MDLCYTYFKFPKAKDNEFGSTNQMLFQTNNKGITAFHL